MKKYQIRIWKPEEYSYPLAFGFIPSLTFYLHEDSPEQGTSGRPFILIVPGGAYCLVSPSEGEIVAKTFYEKGWQAGVLTYTTNLLIKEPLRDQPRRDLCRAMRLIRADSRQLGADPDRLALCGFSAGGHLCADVCIRGDETPDDLPAYAGLSPVPDAAVLSYPVITSGEYGHKDSFRALLGRDASEEELRAASLELQVHPGVPPCFLWATEDDQSVSVQNTRLFAQALREAGVPCEMHIFSHGVHGSSVATEEWAAEHYGEPYTLEQTLRLMEAVDSGRVEVPSGMKQALAEAGHRAQGGKTSKKREPNPEVAVWPDLADRWLREQLWMEM